MHPVSVYELPDGSIDEWISSLSLLEHFPLITRRITTPLDRSLSFLEFYLIGEWKIVGNMIPELSPNNLRKQCGIR